MSDVKKYINKAFRKKRFKKYFKKAWKEWKEESDDFFEDFFKKRKRLKKNLKRVRLYGANVAVRPAYLFAERIESLLKIVFGFSIFVSAIIASFWGFTRTSELLTALINSALGRVFMIFIGFSYFIIGLWKILQLHK
jgi:hypothetical protein